MVKLDLPLRPWVPQWLGLVTVFMVMLPVLMLNGAYTGSMSEVSGTLGVLSEDITMGYYAASAGMAVAYPIVPRVLNAVTPKTLLLTDLTLQVFLSLLCARSANADLMIAVSFLIGFLKAFVMLWFIIHIKPLFTPRNIRSEFYAYFYPIVFSGGQLSMALTAQLAYTYDWKYMYYFMVILLLLALVCILLFFRYARRPIHWPFREMDGRSMLLVSAALLMVMYVFTYGKTLDWFASPRIRWFSLLAPVLFVLFVWKQRTTPSPYVSFRPFAHLKSVVGYLFMIVVMAFSSTSTLVTNYLNTVLKIDSLRVNTLSLWLIPGFLLGAVICFWWFRWQYWRFRILVSAGLFCFVAYFAILYFGISPDSTYEMLFLPVFLRGLGMMILFISFGIFVVEDLDPKLTMSNAFFLITSRSVLSPVIAVSVYSNSLYYLQQKSLHILAENVSLTDSVASGRYLQSLGTYLAQGHGYPEASGLAAGSLYGVLQQQSTLLALKTLLGYLLIGALVLAVVSRFIPFHKTVRFRLVRTGDDMV